VDKETNVFKIDLKELNEIKNSELFCGSFKAYFSTYNTVNYRPDRMVKGCFDKELTRWRNGDKLPKLLAQHYTSSVIGKVTAVNDDEFGAIVEASILNTTEGLDYYKMLKAGAMDEFSFAFYVTSFDYDEDGVRNVLEVSGIDEISIVTWGMDSKTRPIEVNNKELTIRYAEKVLANSGFSKDQAKTIASKGFSALSRDDLAQGRDDLNHIETILALSNLNNKLKERLK
jgi:HK97 family phage prohead protease